MEIETLNWRINVSGKKRKFGFEWRTKEENKVNFTYFVVKNKVMKRGVEIEKEEREKMTK